MRHPRRHHHQRQVHRRSLLWFASCNLLLGCVYSATSRALPRWSGASRALYSCGWERRGGRGGESGARKWKDCSLKGGYSCEHHLAAVRRWRWTGLLVKCSPSNSATWSTTSHHKYMHTCMTSAAEAGLTDERFSPPYAVVLSTAAAVFVQTVAHLLSWFRAVELSTWAWCRQRFCFRSFDV